MWRSIRIPAKNVFNFSIITSKFCTTAAPVRSLRGVDINTVKIVGTLIADPHQLQSGTTQLTVKTQDSAERYSNHNVRINTKGTFVAGQRVFVQGKLGSIRHKLTDEKTITATSIHANKVLVLEDSCGGEMNENSVSIVGNVATDIKVREKDCSFNAVTKFFTKNEQGEEIRQANFHHVVAYDDDIRQYIENNLTKSDRVLISGSIGHMTHTKDDGKRIYSGFIVAQGVSKIARRAKSQDESTENEEIEKEN